MEGNRLNTLMTICLAGVWSCKALYLEMAGPSLIDLKILFNTTYEALSRAVAGRGVGGFLGAVVGGILADKYEDWLELIVGVVQTVAAFSVFCVPYAPNPDFLWVLYVILGLCSGIANIGGTRLILKCWKEKAPAMLSALHAFYGAGAVLVTIIVNPFLAVISYDDPPPAGQGQGHPQTFHVVKETRVHEVIFIIGLITLSFSLPFFVFQRVRSRSKQVKYSPLPIQSSSQSKSFREMINPATYANGSLGYGLYVCVLLMVYFFHLVGGEKVIAHFIRSFSVDVLKFDKNEASYLNMSFWISFTVGRFMNTFIAAYVSVERMLTVGTVLNLLCITVMKSFITGSHVTLWMFTLLQGILISPSYPNGVTYGNTQIDVTGMCLMVIVFAQSLGDMTYIWVAGMFYDSHGPTAILDCFQFSAAALMVTVLLFRIGERPKNKLLSNTFYQ